MSRFDFGKLGLRNILSSPLRSILTVLGIAIGIGAILAVMTLGDAGQSQVESEMARLGIDKVWLTAAQGETLRYGDANALSKAMNTAVTEQVYAPVTVRARLGTQDAILVGCSLTYMNVMDTRILRGRDFFPLEWQADSRSALIGDTLADTLSVNPGDTIILSGIPFQCTGVIAQSNEFSQVDASRAVFVPVPAFCSMFGSIVQEMTISLPRDMAPEAAATMATKLMKHMRGVTVEAVTMHLQIDAANSVMTIFIDVLKWVSAICILVGGIGVMNIQLVSIRERRREIGVMKSLGTSRSQISVMFLLESLIYSLAGGISGLAIGFAIILLGGQSIGLQPILRLSDCLSVMGAALCIGLFFGSVPASRAARLKPVDALREG